MGYRYFLLVSVFISFSHWAVALSKWPRLPLEAPNYTAVNSTEATLSFSYAAEFASDVKPDKDTALEVIEYQLLHLYGPMAEAPHRAVPKLDHTLTQVEITPKEGTENTYLARYHYTGTIAVEKGPATQYEVTLPINPQTIFKQSEKPESKIKYPCTDPQHQNEDLFWYFWNPANEGCPLIEGTHYEVVSASLDRFANTVISYPEYDRLVDEKETIDIALLMGMDDGKKNKNPLTSKDDNAYTYREMRRTLTRRMRYQVRRWSKKEVSNIVPIPLERHPFIEEFTKRGRWANIRIRFFFGPASIKEESGAFQYLVKDALENASIFVYDGHSGGAYLNFEKIKEKYGFDLKANTDRYQIYFFNNCGSYSDYNANFFELKKTPRDKNGTKNLDIITAGLATLFYTGHDTNMGLLRAIDAWARRGISTPYQRMVKRMDSSNLLGVNGDEDNPTRPVE